MSNHQPSAPVPIGRGPARPGMRWARVETINNRGERVLLTTMVPISIPQSELEQVFNQISQSLRSSPEGSSLSNDDVATISLSAMEHKFTTGSSVSSSLQKAMADRNLAGGSGSDSD